MRSIFKLVLPLLVAGLYIIEPAAPAGAEQIKVQKLRFAAKKSLGYTDADVKNWLDLMNSTAIETEYKWAVPCNIRFIQDGPLLNDDHILQEGEFSDIINSATKIDPKVNVVVAIHLDCKTAGGLEQGVAGCAPVNGHNLVLVENDEKNGILLLHERGHNVGLDHADNPPIDVPDHVSERVMVSIVHDYSIGLLKRECDKYLASSLTQVADSASLPPISRSKVAVDLSPLTPEAQNIVTGSWTQRVPREDILSLSADSIKSIRDFIAGPNTAYRANAIQILGYVGTSEDATILSGLLNQPMAAVGPNASSDERALVRKNIQIKYATLDAIGQIADRTKNDQLAKIVAEYPSLPKTFSIIKDEGLSQDLSRYALKTLAKIQTPMAAKLLLSAFDKPETVKIEDDVKKSLLSNSFKEFK